MSLELYVKKRNLLECKTSKHLPLKLHKQAKLTDIYSLRVIKGVSRIECKKTTKTQALITRYYHTECIGVDGGGGSKSSPIQ